MVLSVPLIGAVAGALAAPFVNYRFGRKWTMMGIYLFCIGSTFLQLFAPTRTAFVIGRVWNLVGLGAVTTTAPLYLSEIVPPTIRGAAVAPINIVNVFAGLIATLIVYGTEKLVGHLSYQIPLAIQCVLPVILMLATAFLPESPLWLVSKSRMEDARISLRSYRGWSDAQVDDELRVLKQCEENERALSVEVRPWHIFNRENIKRTLTASMYTSSNVISGVLLSSTYITVFMVELDIGAPFTVTVIAIALDLAGTITAPFVVDYLGRRPCALIGVIGLFSIDVIAGALAFGSTRGHLLGIVALSCIFNFIWGAFYAPLTFIWPVEIATPKLRNYTMSYTIAWSEVAVLITNLAIPQLTAADAANLGAKVYLVFAGCMFFTIFFVYFYMPETAGRSWAEIDEMYDAEVPMRKWRKYQTTTIAKQAAAGKPAHDVVV